MSKTFFGFRFYKGFEQDLNILKKEIGAKTKTETIEKLIKISIKKI